MATSGGQPGNDNAARGFDWRQAIKRALAHKSSKTYREGLDLVATQLVNAAVGGDQWAIREIGERMDGKSPQSVVVDGDGEGGPIKHHHSVDWIGASTASRETETTD